MADTTRNVEVKLKFTGDASGGSKAMADLQAQAGKASKAMADVQTQANRAGKAVADMNNGGGGGKDAAANSSLMIWGKIAAGVYLTQKAVDGLTKAMRIFGDTETSVTEKWRMGIMAIAKEIPILGGLIGGLEGMIVEGMHGDAIRGTAKNKQLSAVAAAKSAAIDPIMARQMTSQREWDTAMFRADQFGGPGGALGWNALIGQAGADESLARGQIHDPGIRGALAGKVGAQRGLNVAMSMAAQDERAAKIRQKEMFKAETSVRDAEGAAQWNPNPWKQQEGQAELERRMNELIRQRGLFETANARARESSLAVSQKEYDLGKASVEVQKAKLGLLQQQADRAKSGAEQFGSWSGADKLALQAAISQAKAHGIDSVPENMRDLITRSGIAQEWGNDLLRKSAHDDPVYRSIVASVGGKTDKQLEAEVAGLKQEIEVKIEVDEKKLAEALKANAETFIGRIISINAQQIRDANDKINLQLQQGKLAEKLAS